jgi:hypothetical protein
VREQSRPRSADGDRRDAQDRNDHGPQASRRAPGTARSLRPCDCHTTPVGVCPAATGRWLGLSAPLAPTLTTLDVPASHH